MSRRPPVQLSANTEQLSIAVHRPSIHAPPQRTGRGLPAVGAQRLGAGSWDGARQGWLASAPPRLKAARKTDSRLGTGII